MYKPKIMIIIHIIMNNFDIIVWMSNIINTNNSYDL